MTDNVELKEKYIEYFRKVPIYRYAAKHIGKDEDTLIRWRKEDEEFAERIEAARADWVEKKMEKISPEFALERIEKEIFAERKELEVAIPKPIMELPDVSNNHSSQENTKPTETD